MGTITSSTTQARPIGYPAYSAIDRNTVDGALWSVVRNTAGALEFRKSTDGGANWGAAVLTYTNANLVEWNFFIDNSQNLHLVFRTNQSSQDQLYYKRVWIGSTPTLGGDVLITAAGNGGSAGAVYTGLDIVAVRFPSGVYNMCVVAGTVSGAKHGITTFGIYMNATGSVTLNNALVGATRVYTFTGSGRQAPTAVLETADGGNGKGSAVPHCWIGFGRTSLYLVKLAWKGTSGGWSSPTTATTLKTAVPAMNSVACRWDGQRWLAAIPNPGQLDQVMLIERNQANTVTATRSTPTHPTGNITQVAVNYNTTNHDTRIYATGTSTDVVYSVEYDRALATWGSWASVTATAIKNEDQFSVRRGTFGNAKHDVAVAHADNSVLSIAQGLTYPPNTPVLNSQPTQARDVNTALDWTWSFSDPDPGDSQLKFAFSRQVGAGSLEYWRTSDSTWQATEQQNTSGVSALTLTATQWALDGAANGDSDPPHTYRVKVWDQASVASGYSVGKVVTPSTFSNPVITAPTAAQVLAVANLTVAWTVGSSNGLYRVRIIDTAHGNAVVYDSGWRISPTPFSPGSHEVAYVLPNGFAGAVKLQTYNAEGLPSVEQTQNFTVAYTSPPAGTIALSTPANLGVIRATITNPAPAGTQPVFASQDVWRRPVAPGAVVMNPNPDFEVNTTGWSLLTATSLTRSTVQFHGGVASARLVPDGVSASARLEQTTSVAIDPTRRYRCEGWVRPDTVNKPVKVYVAWFTAGDVFLPPTVDVIVNAIAGTWLYLAGEFSPPDTAAKAKLGGGINGTPAAGDAAYFDDLKLMLASDEEQVRVGVGLQTGAVLDDYRAVSGVDYEYVTVVTGVNGTTSTGPWAT